MAKGKPRVELLRFGNWPLFRVILLWVVLALIVFTLLGWLWGKGDFWTWDRFLANWRNAGKDVTGLDVIKVSLTTIGGIGGTGYLVIKYRERASAERIDAEEKLLSAVQQLGSESPQVRIAGVYSLENIADTYRGNYKQRVVNILCGYLRIQRGTWKEEMDRVSRTLKKFYVSHDGAVESTVLDVLSRHLRKRKVVTGSHKAVPQDIHDDQLWCDCSIDLHSAVFTELVSFDSTEFSRGANFKGVTFYIAASFACASLNSGTSFEDAVFTSEASFKEATFTPETYFKGAIFNEEYRDSVYFPPSLPLDAITNLPTGAKWARFDDKGNVIEVLSPE